VLKRRLKHHPLSEFGDAEDQVDRLAAWVATDLRRLERWGFMIIISLILSWLVSYLYITNRDARRDYVDTQLRNLACLALHYLPPDSPFYQDLKASYPRCPKYQAPKGVRRSPSATPSKPRTTPSSTPTAQAGQSPVPSASLAPALGSSATATGSRTTARSGHPKVGSTATVHRTSSVTRTATVTARPSPIVSISIPGLPPVPGCIAGIGGIISVRPLVC
jgi:hypothetical protein